MCFICAISMCNATKFLSKCVDLLHTKPMCVFHYFSNGLSLREGWRRGWNMLTGGFILDLKGQFRTDNTIQTTPTSIYLSLQGVENDPLWHQPSSKKEQLDACITLRRRSSISSSWCEVRCQVCLTSRRCIL